MMVGRNLSSKFLVPLIPKNSVGAEIGVWKGESSELFLRSNPSKLYLVDPWKIEHEPSERFLTRYSPLTGGKTKQHVINYEQKIYKQVLKKFKHNSVVEILRMRSHEFFNIIEDRHLDWIYVDGAHDRDGCLYDLEKSWVKVKKGGLIFGNDYLWEKNGKIGVTEAVDEFKTKYNLNVKKLGTTDFVIGVE